MRGIERKLDICGVGTSDLADRLAGNWAEIVEVAPVNRRDPFAADEIVVAGPQGHARIQGFDDLVQHERLPRNVFCFGCFLPILILRLDLRQV